MAKKNEFSDLRTQMQKLQKERENNNKTDQNDAGDKAFLRRVMSAIKPVITAFVENDRLLELQSSDQGFYITYAHFRICMIRVSEPSFDTINIEIEFDQNSTSMYSGTFNETTIKNAVKDALLNWYRSLV